MKKIKLVLPLLSMLIVVGCASNGVVKTATMGEKSKLQQPDIRVDRLVVKSAGAEGTIKEIDATQIIWKDTEGKDITYTDKHGNKKTAVRYIKESVSDPTGKGIIQSAVPIAIGKSFDYVTATKVAREQNKGCRGGNCPAGGQPIINQVYSNANAINDNDSNIGVKTNVGSCKACKADMAD